MGVWLNLATIDDASDTTAYAFGSSTPPTSGDIVAIGINAETQQNLPTVTGTNGWNGLSWTSRVTQSGGGDRVRIMTATSAGGAAGVVTLTWGSALTGCAASLDTHPDITSEVPVQTAKVGSTGTAAPLTMSAFGDAANEGYYVAAKQGNEAVTIGGGYSGFHSWQQANFSGVVGGATNDPTPTATWASSAQYNAAAVEFTAVTGGIPDFAEATGTDDVSAFMAWTAAPTQAQIHRSQEDGFAPDAGTLLATIDGADTAYEDTTAGHDKLWRYLITTTAPVALSAQLDIRMAPPRPIDLTLDSKTQRDAVVSVTRVSSSTRNQHNWYWRPSNRHVEMPGASGDYVSTPSLGAFADDGEWIFRYAADDWTPTAVESLGSEWLVTGNQRAWIVQLNTDGRMILNWSTNGTDAPFKLSNANLSAIGTAGEYLWLKVQLDVSTGDVLFWYSTQDTTDPAAVAWTQLGTTVAGSATSINNSTTQVRISGHDTGTSPMNGNVQRAIILDGIDGAALADFDATQMADGDTTYNDGTNTWTLNGDARRVGGSWIIQHSEDSDNIEGRTNLYDGPGFTAGTTYEFTATSTSTTYGKESGFATLLEVTLESNVIQTGSLVITGYAPNVIATNQTTQLRVSGFHI